MTQSSSHRAFGGVTSLNSYARIPAIQALKQQFGRILNNLDSTMRLYQNLARWSNLKNQSPNATRCFPSKNLGGSISLFLKKEQVTNGGEICSVTPFFSLKDFPPWQLAQRWGGVPRIRKYTSSIPYIDHMLSIIFFNKGT